jgi:hypothetical protein
MYFGTLNEEGKVILQQKIRISVVSLHLFFGNNASVIYV